MPMMHGMMAALASVTVMADVTTACAVLDVAAVLALLVLLLMAHVATTGTLAEVMLRVGTIDMATMGTLLDVAALLEAVRLRVLFLFLGRALGVVLVESLCTAPVGPLALAALFVGHRIVLPSDQ